jgi:Rps23 Pro-64 3,4-dihydroxylase Tpa1-like proline 4-hydroxylase
MLNPSIEASEELLAEKFARAQPFRHVVIDEFLKASFVESLIADFPAFDERRAKNEMGQVGRKAVVPDLPAIGPAYQSFDLMLRDPKFLSLTGRIAGIDNLLYDPEYIGGGTHENLDGQDLDLHVDFNYHPTRLWHRRLNLILFLNPEWQDDWGGCLELHEDPWNPALESTPVRVIPAANRVVLFETTETSWHGFTRITLPSEKKHISRRSAAVYFYTKERPATETAVPHGTIYAPWQLPTYLRAGHTLTAEDMEGLHVLLQRRDGQIRFLYEREKEFSEALTGIRQSASFRAGRALTWPLRKLLRREKT